MKGSQRVAGVFLLFAAQALSLGPGPGEAARELARRIVASGVQGSAVFTFRNISDLGAGDEAAARQTLETELRNQGVRLLDTLPEGQTLTNVRVTVSQNLTHYLFVADIQQGDQHRVLIVPAPRSLGTARAAPSTVSIVKTLVLERPEPILDVAEAGGGILVLQPAQIVLYTQQNGRWTQQQSVPVPPRAWPRDPRGLLKVSGNTFRAYLPGVSCTGATQPDLHADCQESQSPWALSVQAYFAAGRNFFDGRVIMESGMQRNLPAFFSVARAGTQTDPLWLFTGLDGLVHVYDQALQSAGTFGDWGSSVSDASLECAGGNPVLATKPVYSTERDSVQAYVVVNRQPVAISSPVELPGPVTALWTAGNGSATAVARDLGTGQYAAYKLAISCGN